MKTPYDAARRIRQRELDAAREALSDAEAQLTAFAERIEATSAALERERAVAAADPRFDIGPYAAAKRAEIERLYREMARIEADIERLRARLMARFEELKPLDFASEEYLAAKRRDAGKREMTRLDEVAGQRPSGTERRL